MKTKMTEKTEHKYCFNRTAEDRANAIAATAMLLGARTINEPLGHRKHVLLDGLAARVVPIIERVDDANGPYFAMEGPGHVEVIPISVQAMTDPIQVRAPWEGMRPGRRLFPELDLWQHQLDAIRAMLNPDHPEDLSRSYVMIGTIVMFRFIGVKIQPRGPSTILCRTCLQLRGLPDDSVNGLHIGHQECERICGMLKAPEPQPARAEDQSKTTEKPQ